MPRNRDREDFYAEIACAFAERDWDWCRILGYKYYNGPDDYYDLGPSLRGGNNAEFLIAIGDTSETHEVNILTISRAFGRLKTWTHVRGLRNIIRRKYVNLFDTMNHQGFSEVDCSNIVQIGLFEAVLHHGGLLPEVEAG